MPTLEANINSALTQIGQDVAAINTLAKGKADLTGPGGTVPASQLPSYVDDVLEFANLAAFPATGETGKIYIALDTSKIYRWGGSVYTVIVASPGSTDAVPEGTNNLYFTNARASAAAPVQTVAGRTGAVTLTKTDVGLPNADNTSDANKPVSTATQTALNGKENSLPAGTAGQFLASDKTFKPVTAANVGLGSVSNNPQVIAAGGVISQGAGLLSARPAAGTAGRYYHATDQGIEYYDNGTAWVILQGAVTGDVAIAMGGTTATLATVNSNVGTFGTAAKVATVTTNAKGLVTAVSETAITPGAIGAVATSDLGNFNANFLGTYTTARGTL